MMKLWGLAESTGLMNETGRHFTSHPRTSWIKISMYKHTVHVKVPFSVRFETNSMLSKKMCFKILRFKFLWIVAQPTG